jgi:hypothetical protein
VTVPDDGVAEVCAYHIQQAGDIHGHLKTSRGEQFTQLADRLSSNRLKRQVVFRHPLACDEFAITMMGPTNTRLGGDLKLRQVCIPEV